MFERFTERARQVVVLAQDEARRLGHRAIGTEHLLLGLLREEEGLAARVLGAMGIELEHVRAEVVRIAGESEPHGSTGQIPFTEEAKSTLELALRDALAMGHNYIGTEHVLLGLAAQQEGVAAEILEQAVGQERIRDEVMRMLSGLPESAPPPPRRPVRRTRWDYVVEELGALDSNAELTRLGADGWELAAVVGEPGAYRGVFKRPR